MRKPRIKPTFSAEHLRYLKKLRLKKCGVLGAQIGVLAIFLLLWEVLTVCGAVDAFFVSSPSRIVRTIGALSASGELWLHMGITLYECALGFAITTVIGLITAVLLWWNETFRKICEPYIVVLNSLPKIALGPIIIVWVGIGTEAIVMMSILISVVVTVIAMLNGFLACDSDKILLMRSMGANKWQILFKLVLPNAVPDLIAAMKMNMGLSWVGTIMGEYLASKAGLGYLIVYGGQVFRLDLVMCATVLLCIMATVMYAAIAFIEKRIKKKRGSIASR